MVIFVLQNTFRYKEYFPSYKRWGSFHKTCHDLSLKKGVYYQGCLPGSGDAVLKCSHIKSGVVLQYLARICVSAGIPHSFPRCLNSTAAVTTRLHCLKCWKLLLLTWMEKVTQRLLSGLAAWALGGVFWFCFWPFTWNKQGKGLGNSWILKHSKRVAGVMKSNICARSDTPCQPLLPAQAEAVRTGRQWLRGSVLWSRVQLTASADCNVTVLSAEQPTRNAVPAAVCLWVCF